jgi:hypothetical protein
MKGHGEKLYRKQQEAISALLSHSTIEAAAAAINVAPGTMQRWLQLPQFQAEYRAARRQVVEFAIARLQRATRKAVETLVRNLTCGQPSVELRAALAVLEQSIKAIEILELESRVTAIEKSASEMRRRT